MWLVLTSMRRPITILVVVLAVALAAALAVRLMPVDIFPQLGAPQIFVAQPYGGMDPSQMEGFLTYYYEYHFLYITGIEHVESKNIQGVALMKLVFHPGTDMSRALAETVGYVNRARVVHAAGRGASFHRPLRRRQRAGRPVGLLQPHARPRADAGHRAEPRAAHLRDLARRLGAAAFRRQPAHHRDPRGPRPAPPVPPLPGRGGSRRRRDPASCCPAATCAPAT